MNTREFAPIPAPLLSRFRERSFFRDEQTFTIVGPGWELTSGAHAAEVAQMVGNHDAIHDYCARRPDDPVARAVLALLEGNAPD